MAEASTVAAPKVNRREFLYYIWGASLALFTAELGGLIIWFMIPRFREGEFGGNFTKQLADLPPVNTPPIADSKGRFWLVNVDNQQDSIYFPLGDDDDGPIEGVMAIYTVCTHLGCIYDWNAANNRFECPCHGSKYRLDGRRIKDPAPRTLDRFKVTLVDADGNTLSESPLITDSRGDYYGAAPFHPDTAQIIVNTGDKKEGIAQTLLCTIDDSC